MKTRNQLSALIAKANQNADYREQFLKSPKAEIENELGVNLPENHAIVVHESTYDETHLVLEPRDKYSEAEREEAKNGVASLDFLRKTMHDPAPPIRPIETSDTTIDHAMVSPSVLAAKARESIERGLAFLDAAVDPNGAWRCIRFNIANPEIPRHYERPPFVSAYCALALASSNEKIAKSIYARTQSFLCSAMEYPGLWRYYRHLPNDLDSTVLCSLVVDSHPWMLLESHVPTILANRDENGLFMTWIRAGNEPEVVTPFRIEADPVVNANVLRLLGDCAATKEVQAWLVKTIMDGTALGKSKWYPDPISLYYATSRAIVDMPSLYDTLRPILTARILELCDASGEFANVLQVAQAVSALYNIKNLEEIDLKQQLQAILSMQRDDGSWPELLAFGDQALNWGSIGQIGHASESITSAFCIEALERLAKQLNTSNKSVQSKP
ncbi:MAG: hypothetical protein F4W90_08800 [Gammaproteobacteria bacterium]|nr:hypothetical protein [Gammaproteobacteria bacterium]